MSVIGVTLSVEQQKMAGQRVKDAEFSSDTDIILCDYRNIPAIYGGYDKIILVKMLEHASPDHMAIFFKTINSLLANDGMVIVQVITIVNDVHILTSGLSSCDGEIRGIQTVVSNNSSGVMIRRQILTLLWISISFREVTFQQHTFF
jgi:cyclopropane fatty-acyl-phospholipid synthase-like methyltransferase